MYILGGTTLVGAGMFACSGLSGASDKRRADRCQTGCDELIRSGKRDYVIADISLGIAIASLPAEIVVFALQPGSAPEVLDHVPSGLSVSYDSYLGKYLAVHSGGGDDLILRWSDAAAGPFEPSSIGSIQAGSQSLLLPTYDGLEHSTLRSACGETLYASYVLPLLASDGKSTHQQTHLVRSDLK